MKKSFVMTAVVCLTILLAAGSAFAQMTNIVKVTFPVPVTVGTVTLPAGETSIQVLQNDGSASVLLIRSSNGVSVEALASRLTQSESSKETHVTLSGADHQLDKIWLADQHYGYELLSAK